MNKKDFNTLFFSKTRDFLDKYEAQQLRRSENTIESYRDGLTSFRRFITNEKKKSMLTFTFSDCTNEIVLDYMEYLQNCGYAKTTCNHRLSALHAYLWYASDCDVKVLPVALAVSHLPFLRESEVVRDVISSECMAALLAAPGNSRKILIRDTTIMVILYDSAIRLSELLDLRKSDVNLSRKDPYIRIHGKGDKERIVPITDKTVNHLNRYYQHYHNEGSPPTDLLFYTVIHRRVNRMSPQNVQRFIKKYAEKIRPEHPDLPQRVHPHMFRRTRATELYQNGVDLELISRLLGHSALETTKIYAKPSVEMMKKAMDHSFCGYEMEQEPIWDLKDEEEIARNFGLR